MTDPVPTPRPAQPEPVDELAALLRLLGAACGSSVDLRATRAAAEQGLARPSDWELSLEDAAGAVGLRVGWIDAELLELQRQARPWRPAVRRSTQGWSVLTGIRRGQIRVQEIPGVEDPTWVPLAPAQAEARGPKRWAIVEAALPGSPLSTPPGAERISPHARLRGLLRSEGTDLGGIVLYAVAVGILSLATPLVIQVLINWLAFGALIQPVVALATGLLICLALAATLRGLQRVAVEMVERRIFIRIASDVAARFSRLRVPAMDGRSGPELVNRIFDAITVQKATSTLMVDGVAAALQAGVGMLLLAAYHPILMAYDLLVLLAFLGVLFAMGRGATKTAIYESKAKYAVAGWIEEIARHPVAFRLGGAERLAVEEADALLNSWLTRRAAHFKIFLRQYAGALAVQVLANAGLLLLCGWLVLDGALTLGQLVAAEFVVASMLSGFAKFVGKLDAWYDLLAGIDKLGDLVDLPCEAPVGIRRAATGPAAVRFEGLGLDGQDLPTLDLELTPGSRTALLLWGHTRSSLLGEVLVGVRDPDRGALLRDGLDSRAWHPDALQGDSALAGGPDVLYASVLDNVAMGRPGLSADRVWQVLEAVGLGPALRALPAGLDTRMGPTGAPLSSPQVIRLALARAMAGAPRMLVLDATFDLLSHRDRQQLLPLLIDENAPWTFILLTRDPEVAALLPDRFDLRAEPSHA